MYRHKKRGTTYRLMALATYVSLDSAKDDDDLYVAQVADGVWHVKWAFSPEMEGQAWARAQCADSIKHGDVVAVYQSTDDAMLWVRPLAEFEDGRFERVPSDPA